MRVHCPFCGADNDHWTQGEIWRHGCGMEVPARFVWDRDKPDTVLAEYFAQFAAPPVETTPKQLPLWED